MMKRYTYLLAPLLMLAAGLLANLTSSATGMLVGENWLGPAHGQTPAQDLAAYGGSLWRDYSTGPTVDSQPNRVRLLRYPYQSVTAAQVGTMQAKGLWWGLGNEDNNADQDGGLITDAQAAQYVVWWHDNAASIRTGDPTAKVLGPSVWNWSNPSGGEYGLYAYERFLRVYQQQYGTVPPVDALAVQLYPSRYELTSGTESEFDVQLNQAADYAAAHHWGIVVPEWSFWAEFFTSGCPSAGQSEASQYHFVQHGLQSMAGRGVLFALFFGNVHPACDNNGHSAYLFAVDGSLTPPGRAHRDFALGIVAPSPTLPPSATPTATLTRAPTPSSTPPLLVPTATPPPSSTRTATVATPTRSPTALTTVGKAGDCVPTFVKRCM